MADQHKYTVDVTVTENTARVRSIHLRPNADPTQGVERLGMVEVSFEIGEENGGNFVVTDTKTLSLEYHTLGAALLATLDDLEDKALSAGTSNGIFPAGTSEPIP